MVVVVVVVFPYGSCLFACFRGQEVVMVMGQSRLTPV